MPDIREDLEDIEEENFEQQAFVSYSALRDLLSEEKVTLLIKGLRDSGDIQVYHEKEIIQCILKDGLRLFAILLSLSRPNLILKFIEMNSFAHSQLDARLPLSKESLSRIIQDGKLCSRFEKYQWKFVIPFLSADHSYREFHDSARLPIVECREIGEGGLGNVDEISLPASCQDLVPQFEGKVMVVRKQLKTRDDTATEFRKEQHILSMLRCLQHPSIVQLLTTYTIKQTHNFLFPPASGDLKILFSKAERPPGFNNDSDVFQALYELASAIEAIHDYFSEIFNVRKIACHYDLKPDNILYRPGKLILSDFGLSRLRDEIDGSRSLHRNGGGEYFAPECVSVEDDFRKLQVGRSSDIWSFGCILSEIVTYLREGPPGISTFSERRLIVFAGYWTCKAFHAGDRPHPGVVEWLLHLKNSTDSVAIHQLLTTVEDLLEMAPAERPRANELTLRLFYIAQHEMYVLIEEMFHGVRTPWSLEHRVEYERFQLWAGHTGVKDDYDFFRSLQCGDNITKIADLQAARDGLGKLRLELKQGLPSLGDSSLDPLRLSYHIQKAVDGLWDMQSSASRGTMEVELENRLLSTDEKAQLESMEAAFLPIVERSSESTDEEYAQHRPSYKRIGLLAAMKQVAAGLENATASTKNMRLEEKLLKRPLKRFHWHRTGLYQPPDAVAIQVLVELLEYDGSWAKRVDELIERVQDIASFRSIPSAESTFPVLRCTGFCHDMAKHVFSIVYQFPPWPSNSLPAPEIETPMSLRDVIGTVTSRKDRPSLDDIYDIASKLVDVVATMHKANWLHKAISSFNIIFFPQRHISIAKAMKSPYFVGFNHSRLNLEQAFTIPPTQLLEYQHPDYLRRRKRFCQEYEYYSVGLVLLELGCWTLLSDMSAKIVGSPGRLKDALVRTRVPILKTYMGDAYAQAVATCLDVDFGGSSDPAEVRESFERKVVQRIKRRHVR